MAVFSGRVIGTLILGHFLTTRGSADAKDPRSNALRLSLPRTSTARKLAIGSGAIAVARTIRARCCRSGSWRRSGRR
jgi:hypothetical protein